MVKLRLKEQISGGGPRRAGVGVFWGENDFRNSSERLWGAQTNQRAELWAAIKALQTGG